MRFQDLLLALQRYWADLGCVIQQPYDLEVGAGTMHPDTFLRVLGPEPWKVSEWWKLACPAFRVHGSSSHAPLPNPA